MLRFFFWNFWHFILKQMVSHIVWNLLFGVFCIKSYNEGCSQKAKIRSSQVVGTCNNFTSESHKNPAEPRKKEHKTFMSTSTEA